VRGNAGWRKTGLCNIVCLLLNLLQDGCQYLAQGET